MAFIGTDRLKTETAAKNASFRTSLEESCNPSLGILGNSCQPKYKTYWGLARTTAPGKSDLWVVKQDS